MIFINGLVFFIACGIVFALIFYWLCVTAPVHDSGMPEGYVWVDFPCTEQGCRWHDRGGLRIHRRMVPLADLTADLTDEGIDKLIKESR